MSAKYRARVFSKCDHGLSIGEERLRAIVIHEAGKLSIEGFPVEQPDRSQVSIDIQIGGICGSDLHYYNHGGFGTVRLKEPMILGHEVSGVVASVGAGVDGLTEGDMVAVSPSRPCGDCKYCREGLRNQCLNMRFYGSAMPFPHIQGAFRQQLAVDADQCIPVGTLSAAEAAMAEPLSVALHAVKRAGDLVGKRVLVTGCGPIGALCILAARQAGAIEIVATDLSDNALGIAGTVGADRAINIQSEPESLDSFGAGKGTFDVLFECSGSQQALAGGIAVLRPRGVVVQLGLGGDMQIPMMQITAKELDLRGSFRFHEEFAAAVEMMRCGLIDVKPLITHTLLLDDAEQAINIANDRHTAMKVQIRFDETPRVAGEST